MMMSNLSDWQHCCLGDVSEFVTSGSRDWAKFYSESGSKFIRMTNLTRGGIFLDQSNLKYVNIKSDSSDGKRTSLKPGDVLISITAELGKIGWVPEDIGEAYINQHTALVRLKKNVDSKFVAYLLSSKKLNNTINRLNDSGAKAGLNLPTVRKIPIHLPPFPEQKAIANLLSTWDEAIEMTERLIQVKEKQLDAYGRKLFSRKNEMRYSGWEQVTLNDVLTEHGDKSTGQEEVYSVSVHKGLINQVEHLGRSFSAANTDHYNKVHYGDIVYTKSPTGDFPLGIVKQSHTKEDVIVSPLYGVFTPTCFSLGVVIDFYFSSPTRAKNYLFPIIQKGAKNTIAITNKTFLSKKLYLPLDEEAQKVVSEYITTSKKEIDLLKQLAEKYKTQKRGLMQKMLTGEWRVKDEIISKYREA